MAKEITGFLEHEGALADGLRTNPQVFKFEDVEHIEKSWTDGSDEPNWVWLIRLRRGIHVLNAAEEKCRWVVVNGGHDYTGWDCQSSLSVSYHPTKKAAIRWGLDKNERENLGLQLPEEAKADCPSFFNGKSTVYGCLRSAGHGGMHKSLGVMWNDAEGKRNG